MKKYCLLVFVFGMFLLDFSLKKYVLAHSIDLMSGAQLFGFQVLPNIDFSLVYVENTGMAWGMFSSFQSWILVLRILLVVALVAALFSNKYVKANYFGFLLIIFGAFGNILDTVIYGHVIDMIHVTFWQQSYGVFNVADAMIFLGAFFLMFKNEVRDVAKE